MLKGWNQRLTGKDSVVFMTASLKSERMWEDGMIAEVTCLLAFEMQPGLNSAWNGLLVTDSQKMKTDQVAWEWKVVQ